MNERTNERRDIVTPWAPVGAKKGTCALKRRAGFGRWSNIRTQNPDTDTQITLILYRLLSFHSDTQTTPTLTQTIPNCTRTYRLLPFLLRHPDYSHSYSDTQTTPNLNQTGRLLSILGPSQIHWQFKVLRHTQTSSIPRSLLVNLSYSYCS